MIYLARIAAADFEAFRVLMKDQLGAASFEEWAQTLHQQIELYSGTDTVIVTDVNPKQFADFCHEGNRAYNMRSLLEFAESIAKRGQRK